MTDFLWSYSSYLHQIWIIWLILHNLSFHEKKLTFKGQEGQERPCNFLFQNFWELRLMQNQFLSKKNHFWFIQNLNLVEFEGVYCTVAYPCWPLKAKKFSSKHSFLRKWSMVKIGLIYIHWFLRYRGGSKSQTRQGVPELLLVGIFQKLTREFKFNLGEIFLH